MGSALFFYTESSFALKLNGSAINPYFPKTLNYQIWGEICNLRRFDKDDRGTYLKVITETRNNSSFHFSANIGSYLPELTSRNSWPSCDPSFQILFQRVP